MKPAATAETTSSATSLQTTAKAMSRLLSPLTSDFVISAGTSPRSAATPMQRRTTIASFQ